MHVTLIYFKFKNIFQIPHSSHNKKLKVYFISTGCKSSTKTIYYNGNGVRELYYNQRGQFLKIFCVKRFGKYFLNKNRGAQALRALDPSRIVRRGCI